MSPWAASGCWSRLKAGVAASGQAAGIQARGLGAVQLCSERPRAGRARDREALALEEAGRLRVGWGVWLTLRCPPGVQRLRGRPSEHGQRLDRDGGRQCPLPRPERRGAEEAELCMGLGPQAPRMGGCGACREGSDELPGTLRCGPPGAPRLALGEAGLYTFVGILSPELSSVRHVPNPELGPRGPREQTQAVICRTDPPNEVPALCSPAGFRALQAFSEGRPKWVLLLPCGNSPVEAQRWGSGQRLGCWVLAATPGSGCAFPRSTCTPATPGCPSDGRSWTSASRCMPTTRPSCRRWPLCSGPTTEPRAPGASLSPAPRRSGCRGRSCGPRGGQGRSVMGFGDLPPLSQLEPPLDEFVTRRGALGREPRPGTGWLR